MDLYRELILDHYKHPRNFGHLENPDVIVEEGNVTCGDRIIMEIKCKDKHLTSKVIESVSFNGEGCAVSQASASMLTDSIKGKTSKYIMDLDLKYITRMLGTTLTPSRVKCALLPLEVLQKGILLLKNT